MPKKKKVARKATAGRAKTAVSKPGAAKAGRGKFGAKAAFVRAHPDLAAKKIVDLAAKAGLAMTVNHVYNVRSTSGISRRKVDVASRPEASAKAPKLGKLNSSEAQFRRLVLEIGAARARKILHDVETRLAAILSGR